MADVTVINQTGLGSFCYFAQSFPYFGNWGTGTGSLTPASTALFTEAFSASNDGSGNTRPAVAGSLASTTTPNDTVVYSVTMTAAGTISITEAGLNDTLGTAADLVTAPSGGNQILQALFAAPIALTVGQTIDFVHEIVYANG